MFSIEHTGKRIERNGHNAKVGPRGIRAKDKIVLIAPGETKDVDLSDDDARRLISIDGGPLRLHLTEAQAKRLNRPVPVLSKKESKDGLRRPDSI